MTRLRHASRRRGPRRDRGVALLLVLVGLALLALVASEVRYNSVVELRLATNARDEVRAHFLAKSGVGLSRLVLKFQRQLDQLQLPNLGGMVQQLLGGAAGGGAAGGGAGLQALAGAVPGLAGALGGAAGGAGGAPQTMSLQLWRMAKVDCMMLQAMIPQGAEPAPGAAAPRADRKLSFDDELPEVGQRQAQRSFGQFEGCFDSVITDEEERINLNKLDAPQLTAVVIAGQLASLLNDKKYEFLFEREDTHRTKVTPNDVILGLRDWIDEDDTASQLNLTGQGEPFLKGFSDEAANYSRYEPRMQPKNGRFDSLDELYVVHGVGDRFMAAFKDRLTVYPDVNSKLNVNTDDPVLLELAIRSVADPARADPRLQDPVFIDMLIQKLRAARVFALFGMSAVDFVNVLAANGVFVNPTILSNPGNQRFIGDKSTTYRLRVTGTAGDVSRTITTVIRLDDGLGRLVYWREE